jgi:hypothetical protein
MISNLFEILSRFVRAPQPPYNAGRPDTAPSEVLEDFTSRTMAAFAERRVRVDTWISAYLLNERVHQ